MSDEAGLRTPQEVRRRGSVVVAGDMKWRLSTCRDFCVELALTSRPSSMFVLLLLGALV